VCWPIIARLVQDRWTLAPIVIVRQGRVAVGDEISRTLNAEMAAVLIGERPGLSAPDSLGVYLTWQPRPGVTDAQRNCISNIRPQGLSYQEAARTLIHLMCEARRLRLTGVQLSTLGTPASVSLKSPD
jgi:ethanolamine ammonia-lyase small subunit